MPRPWPGRHPTPTIRAHISWRISPGGTLAGMAKWLVINSFRCLGSLQEDMEEAVSAAEGEKAISP